MNVKKLMLYSIVTSLVVISCKKDKTTESNPVITESIKYKFQLPLAIGNYWVYQTYEVDSNGIEIPFGNVDSCFVAGDTLIGNNTYFKWWWKPMIGQFQYFFVRDSSGYNVDYFGNILNGDFTIGDTLYHAYDSAAYFYNFRYYAQPPNSFVTPAGSFNNLKMITSQINFDSLPYSAYCPLNFNHIEADGIGEIFDELTFTNNIPLKKKHVRKLIRYHLL